MPTAGVIFRWKSRPLLALALLLAPGAAVAQGEGATDAPAPPPGVEEIVIIGVRTSAGVSADEMVSVTQFDASALEAMGVDSVADLAPYTPNLEIRSVGSTATTFFIRGVGLNDFTSNAAGAVAIYHDDVQLNLPAIQSLLTFDLTNFEVLRGPQGSGFSRNASAGAIKSYSTKPTGEIESYLRGDYGNLDAVDVEGALGFPLLGETLASRMAFRVRQRGGLFENRCGGLTPQQAAGLACSARNQNQIQPGLPEELSDIDAWGARHHLRMRPPGSDTDWLFSMHGGRVDQLGSGGEYLPAEGGIIGSPASAAGAYQSPELSAEQQAIFATFPTPPTDRDCRREGPPPSSPAYLACLARRNAILTARQDALAESLVRRPLDSEPFEVDVNLPGFEKMDTIGGFLRGEWELPSAALHTLTSYEHYAREREIDADFSPNKVFEFQITDRFWQAAQSLGAKGELAALPVEWQLGAYGSLEELNYRQTQLPGGILPRVNQHYVQKSFGAGVFGQLSWHFLDDFALEGGARYNYERKSFDAEITFAGRDTCAPLPTITPECQQVAIYQHPTGTLGLKYFLREDVSLYWKYTHGWKGPQFNARDGRRAAFPIDRAKPEKIDAFESGFRGSWLDDRLSLGGAVFWYRYANYQTFIVTNDANSPPQRIVVNANDAQLYGAELDATLEPLESLVLDLRVGWLESKFLDFSDTGFRQQDDPNSENSLPFFFTIDYNGNRLPNTPRFKLSASANYTFDLGRYGELVPNYEVNWSDEVYFDPSEGRGVPSFVTNQQTMPRSTIGERPLLLQNARLTYRMPGGGVEISGWVRNLTDEVYKTFAFDASSAAGFVGNFVGEPRTYGLSVKASF